MPSIFKSKRQKSIVSRKQINYLFYTVGEILLIVIGILIALKVNNLNEKQKARQLEKEALGDLIAAMVTDSMIASYNADVHQNAALSIQTILSHFEQNLTYHDSLDQHFAAAFHYTNFVTDVGAYESLISKGFEIISDKELRFEIIHLYQKLYGILLLNDKKLKEDIQFEL